MERSAIRGLYTSMEPIPDFASLYPGYSSELLARRTAELGLQRGDPGLQGLVLLAGQPGHVLDCVELLALDHVEVAQNAFGLVAHDRVDLALDTLGSARGIVHQTADLVE